MSYETPTDLAPASSLMLVSPTTLNPNAAFARVDPAEKSSVFASTHVQITYKRAPSGKSVTVTATVLTGSGEKPTGTLIFEVQSLPTKEIVLQHGAASIKIKAYLLTGTIIASYGGDTRHASSSKDLVITSTTMMSGTAPVRGESIAPGVAAEVVQQGAPSSNATLDDLDDVTLADRIVEFWSADQSESSTFATRRDRLKNSRVCFGEYLAAYQQRLAIPGRDGKWASFLRGIHMPKSSASRYIKQWEFSVRPKAPKEGIAENAEPSEEDVSVLVAKLKSRVRNVLTTPESVAKFLSLFTAALQPPTSV